VTPACVRGDVLDQTSTKTPRTQEVTGSSTTERCKNIPFQVRQGNSVPKVFKLRHGEKLLIGYTRIVIIPQ